MRRRSTERWASWLATLALLAACALVFRAWLSADAVGFLLSTLSLCS